MINVRYALGLLFLIFFVIAPLAQANVLIENVSSVSTGTNIAQALSWTHTTGGSQNFLLVGVSINTNTIVSSVYYGNTPLIKLTALESGNAVRVSLWYLLNPPVGQNEVTVNLSNSARFVAGAQTFSGVNQLTPFGVPVAIGGSGATASINIPSSTGELVVDLLARRGDLTTNPISSNDSQSIEWTARTTVNSSSIGVTGGGSAKAGTLLTNMSWTWPMSRRWALAAISLKPAQLPPDNIAPLRFNGFPSGILPAGTTNVVTSLITDENATCRYSMSPGQTYLQMTNQFSDTGGVTHTENITGLSDGGLYNFYVRCSDTLGNRNGDDFVIAFSVAQSPPPPTDTEPPSIPQNLNAIPVSYSEIDLSWTASSDNIGVVGYRVFRGGAFISSVIANTFADTGLLELTSYIYEVLAFDAAENESQKSTSYEITTPAKPTEIDDEPPSMPQNLVASPISVSEIILSWDESSDNIGVVAYHIYRDGNLIAIELGLSFQDSRLNESTMYSYGVTAIDYSGNESGFSQEVSATTFSIPPSPDTKPPLLFNGLPTGVLPSNIESTMLSIETDENAECKYALQPGVAFGFMPEQFITIGGTHHEKLVTGLGAGSDYDYYIRCKDESDNVNSNDFNIMFSIAPLVDVMPPRVPSGLMLIEKSSAQIKFIWQGSSDNVGVDGYKIFRNDFLVATTKGTEYSDMGLAPETTYSYSVSAFDAAGNTSERSLYLSVKTLPEGASPVAISQGSGGATINNADSNFVSATAISDKVSTMNEVLDEFGVNEENALEIFPMQFKFTSFMFLGLSGNDIEELQKLLASDQGFYPEGLITGYFGELTRRAVQRFQCQLDIVCSGKGSITGYGIVGTKTLSKLNTFAELSGSSIEDFLFKNRSLSFGLTSKEVKKLQETLALDRDIYPEGLITGYFGELTRRAVQRYQCIQLIVCDGDEVSTGYGRVGPRTREKLRDSTFR